MLKIRSRCSSHAKSALDTFKTAIIAALRDMSSKHELYRKRHRTRVCLAVEWQTLGSCGKHGKLKISLPGESD